MNKIVSIVFVLIAGIAFAEPIPQEMLDATPRIKVESSALDTAARVMADNFMANWNNHDTAALAAMWTEDGDYTEPDGRTVQGYKELKRLFDIEHRSVFRNTELNLVVERTRAAGDTVAIVDGTYELFGATDPAGNEIGTRTGYSIIVMVKQGDEWKVSASRLMLPANLIWRAR